MDPIDLYIREGMGDITNGSYLYYGEQCKHNNTHDYLIYYGKEGATRKPTFSTKLCSFFEQ